MIGSFKQYLLEARMAPLYHGTYPENLDSILLKKRGILPVTRHDNKDLLLKSSERYDETSGVSFSRSIHFAFAHRVNMGVVLEVDQQKLTQKYRLIPVNYWSRTGARFKGIVGKTTGAGIRQNEYEEFVVTDKPIPSSYITKIWVSPQTLNSPTVEKIRQQYGSSFIGIVQ